MAHRPALPALHRRSAGAPPKSNDYTSAENSLSAESSHRAVFIDRLAGQCQTGMTFA